MSSIRQCIASECDSVTRHKSEIFLGHICDRKLLIHSSESWTSFQFTSYTSYISSNIFVGLQGWIRLPSENHVIHDFRQFNLALYKRGELDKRASGSVAFSTVNIQPTASTSVIFNTFGLASSAVASAETTPMVLTSSIATSPRPTSSSSSPSNVTNPVAQTSALPSNSGGGLSSSAKVGLGLGITLGLVVLAMLIAGVYFFGKRRGRQAEGHGQDDFLPQQPELISQPATGIEFKVKDAIAQPTVAELPLTYSQPQHAHELPAGPLGAQG